MTCRQLVSLSVEHNTFDGSIPPELFANPKLHFISLEHNALTGTIPDTIGNCVCLQKVWLGNNNLVGTIPKTLSNCKMLHSFGVEHNQMSGVFESEMFRTSCPLLVRDDWKGGLLLIIFMLNVYGKMRTVMRGAPISMMAGWDCTLLSDVC